MGLFSDAREWVTDRVTEVASYAARKLAEVTLAYPYPLPEDDERDWSLLATGGTLVNTDEKRLEETNRIDLRKKARILTRYSPHGRAIVRTYIKYVLGGGQVMPRFPSQLSNDSSAAQDEALQDVLKDKVWKPLSRSMDWREFGREALTRYVRDGEVFIWRFSTIDGLALRFIDPELIRDPDDTAYPEEGGIVTEDGDAQTVIEYIKVKASDHSKVDVRIPAKDVIHYKACVDSNEMRGVTYLAPVLGYIEMYSGWLSDRMILNRARTNVALIRKFDASKDGMESFLAREASRQDTLRGARGDQRPARNSSVRQTRIRPGTVINALKGISYEFIAPNLQAADVHHDGKAILLGIAAGTGLAEFMVSGDASNANFASVLVSEGPAVKEFQDLQQVLHCIFTRVWVWKVEDARASGAGLNGSATILNAYDPQTIEWSFPDIVARDRKKERDADVSMQKVGALSVRTIMERDGIEDTDQEFERIEQEKEANMARMLSMGLGSGEDEEEGDEEPDDEPAPPGSADGDSVDEALRPEQPDDRWNEPAPVLRGPEPQREFDFMRRATHMAASGERVRRLCEAMTDNPALRDWLLSGDVPPGYTQADVTVALEATNE